MIKCETPERCRISANGPGMTTCAYYPPIYDGYGNNINPDRNITTSPMRCATCGKEWIEKSGGWDEKEQA
jgi:hypothetical protein